jgi:hypothetical protein
MAAKTAAVHAPPNWSTLPIHVCIQPSAACPSETTVTPALSAANRRRYSTFQAQSPRIHPLLLQDTCNGCVFVYFCLTQTTSAQSCYKYVHSFLQA